MRKTLLVTVSFLFFSGTALYGQSFTKSEWEVISLNILNEHARLVQLEEERKMDSIAIEEMVSAYLYQNKALKQANIAIEENKSACKTDKEAHDQTLDKLNKDLKRERRKFRIAAALAVIAAIL